MENATKDEFEFKVSKVNGGILVTGDEKYAKKVECSIGAYKDLIELLMEA